MNILVTGCNGQLGTHMRLISSGSRHNYLFTDIGELDITDQKALNTFIEQNHIEAIVNCAAYTNVDKAEDEETIADSINHIAVGYMAEAMRQVDGLLIHISTDYVFGGNQHNTPCREDAAVNPTGAYGRTKLRGEETIRTSGCRYIILRTAWLYSEYGKNFCKTMLNLTATKPQLNVVFDQVGTPTYAGDLAYAIFRILEDGLGRGNEGLYHFSNEGVCSWYDFAIAISRKAGNTKCDILPCHSNEFPSPVIRPPYSVLDKTKFKQTFHLPIPYWTDSLDRCLTELNKNK